ncbi:hypothetical protein ACFLX4_03715 [Chloroflexota bacterium]
MKVRVENPYINQPKQIFGININNIDTGISHSRFKRMKVVMLSFSDGVMRSRFVKERCPKCNGNIYLDTDNYGWYEQCIQCGYIYDEEGLLKAVDRVSMGNKEIPTRKEPGCMTTIDKLG